MDAMKCNKDGWVKKKLGEVASYINGYAFKPSQWEETGMPIIRIQNLNNPNSEYNYFSGELPSKYIVETNDILISWSASLGVYEWKRGKALLNQHIFKVLFNKIDIDKYYLKYAVGSRLTQMTKDLHGATMKHIVKKDFDNIEIPYPPLAEQQRIVAEMDCLNGIIEKQKEQMKQLDELAQSIFYDLFGDPMENEKGWALELLESLSDKISDGEHLRPQIVTDGIPFLSAKDITNGYVDFSDPLYVSMDVAKKSWNRCHPEENDILLISRGATIGRVCIVQTSKKFCLLGSVILIKKKSLDSKYLLYALKSKSTQSLLQSLCGAIAQPAIYLKDVKKIKVPVPPLSLQQTFASKIEAIEHQKELIKKSITETETLFSSRMDYYFG